MAEYQKSVDEIRFHLQSGDCELTDELQVLAATYAKACREANERLRRCGDFLRQGLRSEAIHLAEKDPNLLDLVALLDFAERAQWDEVLSLYQIPKGEPLLIDVGELLNEAYAVEQPLQKLLARHRLLALRQAPLPQRLAVMRRLAELDAQSSFWDEDIRSFEQARFRQVEREARDAAAHRDFATLQALNEELSRNGWREPRPKALVQGVKRLATQVTRGTSRDELKRLEIELDAAFGALDLSRARVLRDRWNRFAAQAKLPSDDPLLERVGPVLGWIEDEDAKVAAERRYERAVAELEIALDDEAMTPHELEQLGHAVHRCGRGIPEPLATRYRNRIAGLELAETRQRRLLIGSAALVLVLVVGLMGVILYRNLQATEMKRITASIEQMIDDGQLGYARELFEKNPHIVGWESGLAVVEKLGRAEKDETDREGVYREAIAKATELAEAQSYDAALVELDKASGLARTTEERLEIQKLTKEWQSKRSKLLAEREAKFRDGLDAVRNDLNTFGQRLRQPPSDAAQDPLQQLEEQIENQLSELEQAKQGVGKELGDSLALPVANFLALRKERDQVLRKKDLSEQLTTFSTMIEGGMAPRDALDQYVGTLTKYAEEFRDEPRSADFGDMAAEAELWRGVLEWQRLCSQWRKTLLPSNVAVVRDRIRACEDFLKAHHSCPAGQLAQEYLTYLKAVRQREEDEHGDPREGLRARMLALYSGPLMEEAHILRTKKGNYYLSAPASLGGKTFVSFKYMMNFNAATQSKTLMADQLLKTDTEVAPQVWYGAKVKLKMQKLTLSAWEPTFQELAQELLDDTKLDPVLRCWLLRKTLEYVTDENSSLGQELAPLLKRLDEDPIRLDALWMDPENPIAEKARTDAPRFLSQIQDLPLYWKRAAERDEKLAAKVFQSAHIVGWLGKDAGEWKCHTNWKAKNRYSLKVVRPPDSTAGIQWSDIGAAEPDELKLQIARSNLFKEGRLVFAFEENPEAAKLSAQ